MPRTKNQPEHQAEEVVVGEVQEVHLEDPQGEVHLHEVHPLAEDTVTCHLLEEGLHHQDEVACRQNEMVRMVVVGMTAMKDLLQNVACHPQIVVHIHHQETMTGGVMTVREKDPLAMVVIDMVISILHQREVTQVIVVMVVSQLIGMMAVVLDMVVKGHLIDTVVTDTQRIEDTNVPVMAAVTEDMDQIEVTVVVVVAVPMEKEAMDLPLRELHQGVAGQGLALQEWSKPVMEKRRRERINKSLEELKQLVLQAQRRDSSRYARLEKADILEMTVQHLRTIRNRSISSSQHLSRTTLRGIHFGCQHCSPLTDLVTMETRQATSRHLPIAPKPNQYVTPMKCDSNAQQTDLVPPALSPPSVGNLSHQNTAVQCIPLWQDGMRNSCLSIPESSGELWRPF